MIDPEFHSAFPDDFRAATVRGYQAYVGTHDTTEEGCLDALHAYGQEMFNSGAQVVLVAREQINA